MLRSVYFRLSLAHCIGLLSRSDRISCTLSVRAWSHHDPCARPLSRPPFQLGWVSSLSASFRYLTAVRTSSKESALAAVLASFCASVMATSEGSNPDAAAGFRLGLGADESGRGVGAEAIGLSAGEALGVARGGGLGAVARCGACGDGEGRAGAWGGGGGPEGGAGAAGWRDGVS